MLHTIEEISKIYSTNEVRITPSTIRRWVKKGLKHITGDKGKFLFKTEWIDTFLETEAEKNVIKEDVKDTIFTPKIKKRRNTRIVKMHGYEVV